MEVFWTGLNSFLSGNLSLYSKTSIWMFFIYGLAVFLEPTHDRIRRYNFFIRGLIWATLIFFIEFLSGATLDYLIGSCPWDYRGTTSFTIKGYIRFDYLPVWFNVGLFFEKIHIFIDNNLNKIFNSLKNN